MLVELMTVAAGAVCGAPGDVVEVTDEQAGELITGGYAKAVSDGIVSDTNDDPAPTANKRPKGTPKGK